MRDNRFYCIAFVSYSDFNQFERKELIFLLPLVSQQAATENGFLGLGKINPSLKGNGDQLTKQKLAQCFKSCGERLDLNLVHLELSIPLAPVLVTAFINQVFV